MTQRSALPRPVLAAVIALPLLLAAAVTALALFGGRLLGDQNLGDPDLGDPERSGQQVSGQEQAGGSGAPLAVPAVPAPAAGSPECSALLAALPAGLQSGATRLDRRPLVSPAPQGTVAWDSAAWSAAAGDTAAGDTAAGDTAAGDSGASGVRQPVILRCGLDRPVELTRTAELLEVDGVRWLRLAGEPSQDGAATWVAVDRPVYVALTLPGDAGTGPLQEVSSAITASLPVRAVQPVG